MKKFSLIFCTLLCCFLFLSNGVHAEEPVLILQNTSISAGCNESYCCQYFAPTKNYITKVQYRQVGGSARTVVYDINFGTSKNGVQIGEQVNNNIILYGGVNWASEVVIDPPVYVGAGNNVWLCAEVVSGGTASFGYYKANPISGYYADPWGNYTTWDQTIRVWGQDELPPPPPAAETTPITVYLPNSIMPLFLAVLTALGIIFTL